MSQLTHLDDTGAAHMVDVGAKPDRQRTAVAEGQISMRADTLRQIIDGALPKGDVLATARLAGIMAAKRTSDLIPLCHPIALSRVAVDIEASSDTTLTIRATVSCTGKTGVEMEALTAVSVAGLTLYDMAKALDKAMVIGDIRLLSKTGGKSGDWQRDDQR